MSGFSWYGLGLEGDMLRKDKMLWLILKTIYSMFACYQWPSGVLKSYMSFKLAVCHTTVSFSSCLWRAGAPRDDRRVWGCTGLPYAIWRVRRTHLVRWWLLHSLLPDDSWVAGNTKSLLWICSNPGQASPNAVVLAPLCPAAIWLHNSVTLHSRVASLTLIHPVQLLLLLLLI